MTTIFSPKPFVEIVADQVERVRLSTDLLTDFNVGSVTRSLLEANAVELDDYYQEMYLGLLRAIPTAIYIGFSFDLRPAVAAGGIAVFTRQPLAPDDAQVIPAGTRLVSASGAYYVTDAEVTLAEAAETVSVTISAEVVGTAGNADPHSLLLVNSSAWYAVDNPAILSGGADAETEEQRAERFAAFIRALARATPAAMEYAATIPAIYHPITGVLAERVQRAALAETAGHCYLYIANGSYGASDTLIDEVQQLIDGYQDPETNTWVGGYRPAGMWVEVRAMIGTAVNISLELTAAVGTSTATITSALEGALDRWLRATVPGVTVRPVDLINVALKVDGVNAVTVLAPTAAWVVAANTTLYLGDLTLTWTA